METLQLTPNFQLSYHWEADRQALRGTRIYRTLEKQVSSSRLLSPRFFALLTEMVNLAKSIEEQVVSRDFNIALAKGDKAGLKTSVEKLLDFHPSFARASAAVKAEYASLTVRYLTLSASHSAPGKRSGQPADVANRACRHAMGNVLRLSERLRRLDQRLSLRLPELGGVVSGVPLFKCRCGNFLIERRIACPLCGKMPRGDPLSVAKCDPTLVEIVARRAWLELAVSNLFRENGFETIVGAHVHGPSHVAHEMDVVAFDLANGVSAAVEVTAGAATLSQMEELMLRKPEFPFQNYLLVTLGPSDPKALRYGQTHGVWVFGELRKTRKHLVRWIKDYRKHTGRLAKLASAGIT
jgi:hypothetical protein